MKFFFNMLLSLLIITGMAYSQNARLQVIHNAADPAAATVDVYLNGTILLDDFSFRTATPFIDAPAGTTINVGIAPGNSSSAADTLKNFPLILAEDETYVAVANGVLDPHSFEANPDGRATAFTLFINPMAKESGDSTAVEFFVTHGATDAPAVDVIARNVATLVNDAAYGDMTGYISVPPAEYSLDVTPGSDNNTVVATFKADLSGLAGGAAAVFASGFLSPGNDQNGAAFGIFAALPSGDVVAFDPVITARLQVIHNAADPAAASVDVYLNDGLLLDDFAFRTATAFIDAPANQVINVGVAAGNSASAADTLKNFGLNLLAGETYIAIANGVLDPNAFETNPDGKSTAFTLFINALARVAGSTNNQVDFFAVHGATDAPTVDIIARNVATLVDDAAYGAMTGYISVPPAEYSLDITPGSDNNTVVATFKADLSGLAGGAAAVFASGFLSPGNDQNGAAFGIFAALPSGDVVAFDPVTTARLQVIHNAADPAAARVDVYLNDGLLLDDFAFRAATPFIDAPANQVINVGVAAGNSASAADTLKNFGLNLLAGETYIAIANGVLDPNAFEANPDGRTTAFTLFINSMAKESADSSNVDFFVVHGASDAPTVDVIARDVATLVDNAAYADLTGYISVPPASYILDITPGNDNNTIVASFIADLSSLGGQSAIVLASGFLSPDNDQNSLSFGLIAVLADGTVISLNPVTALEEIGEAIPVIFDLKQNYPNPFNPETQIEFSIPANQKVALKVYDISGREVAELLNDNLSAGVYSVPFNATNLSSGIYFYRLQTDNFVKTRRMTLLK